MLSLAPAVNSAVILVLPSLSFTPPTDVQPVPLYPSNRPRSVLNLICPVCPVGLKRVDPTGITKAVLVSTTTNPVPLGLNSIFAFESIEEIVLSFNDNDSTSILLTCKTDQARSALPSEYVLSSNGIALLSRESNDNTLTENWLVVTESALNEPLTSNVYWGTLVLTPIL